MNNSEKTITLTVETLSELMVQAYEDDIGQTDIYEYFDFMANRAYEEPLINMEKRNIQ